MVTKETFVMVWVTFLDVSVHYITGIESIGKGPVTVVAL